MPNFNVTEVLYAIRALRTSPLFDEKWYKNEYGGGGALNGMDAVSHYFYVGWQEGRDPSPYFSTNGYLKRFPEVKCCPLLHFEYEGLKDWKYRRFVDMDALRAAHPELLSTMEDGLVRVRMTNACNARCRYCGITHYFSEENKQKETGKEWIFNALQPVYEQIKMLLLTGGDPLFTKHSFDYVKFISENYPHITAILETNGILFTEKYQQLAMENLHLVHISINASNENVYEKSCWKGGGKFFKIFTNNAKNYVDLLEKNGRVCFAPDISMVINHDNYFDVLDFARFALQLKASRFGYYFDYTEVNMSAKYFPNPELFRPILKQLLELERVLKNKVMMSFRLWIPTEEVANMQPIVDAESDEELEKKYADIVELAKDRDILAEHLERNRLRQQLGKKTLTLDEDCSGTVRLEKRDGKNLCFAPWKELDFYPDGRLDFCGWLIFPTIYVQDFVDRDGFLNWYEVMNSYEYMRLRHRILMGDYDECMNCCPMNDAANPIVDVFKYSLPSYPTDKRLASGI